MLAFLNFSHLILVLTDGIWSLVLCAVVLLSQALRNYWLDCSLISLLIVLYTSLSLYSMSVFWDRSDSHFLAYLSVISLYSLQQWPGHHTIFTVILLYSSIQRHLQISLKISDLFSGCIWSQNTYIIATQSVRMKASSYCMVQTRWVPFDCF